MANPAKPSQRADGHSALDHSRFHRVGRCSSGRRDLVVPQEEAGSDPADSRDRHSRSRVGGY